jgi:hypothetical protein
MKIDIATSSASLEDADGVIWQEKFTFDECQGLANLLDQVVSGQQTTIGPLQAALERVRDIFFALQNDSAACIITGPETTP